LQRVGGPLGEISEERRNAERESANQSAALRQMDAEVARLERRLDDWIMQSERNKDLRGVRQTLIEEKREEVARLEADHAAAEIKVNELQQNMEELRRQREQAQQQAAMFPRCWRGWKSAAAAQRPPSPASIACTATWNGGSTNWSSSWPPPPPKNSSARGERTTGSGARALDRRRAEARSKKRRNPPKRPGCCASN
jgi:septal ring factor EnvC (AmiA/AmiB activator)